MIRRVLIFLTIAAGIGLVAGGWFGMFLGAALGYGLGLWVEQVLLPRGLGAVQARFLDATFAVMGALCKADGRVSSDEIRVVEQFFDRLALSAEQRSKARAAFNRGKQPGFDLAAEIAQLRGVVRNHRALLQLFMQVQLSAIVADGVLHDDEHAMMLRVARLLGLSEMDLRRLEAMLGVASGAGDGGGARHGPAPSGGPSAIEAAYVTLGVEPSASDAEVKKAYRRLMSRHHPDKLASRGMPESMRPMAEARTHEIRKAYETVVEARKNRRAA